VGTDAAVKEGGLPDQGQDAPIPDGPVADQTALDQAIPDLPLPDVPVPDQAVPDAPVPDQAVPDAPVPDQAVPDAPVPDQAVPDAPAPDQSMPDAPVPDLPLPDKSPAPDLLPADLGPDTCSPCSSQAQCDDKNPCTKNSCNSSGCCVSTFVPATTKCNDNLSCTTGDHCDGAGKCRGTPYCCTSCPCTHVSGWCVAGGTGFPSGLNVNGIWGTNSTNVWVVGDGNIYVNSGLIWHYNGKTWTAQYSTHSIGAKSIWGSSNTDIFAGFSNGQILHYDGATWKATSSGITDMIFGIWGTSSSNVYAVGRTHILRYDGSKWNKTQFVGTPFDFRAVWGSGPSDVWVMSAAGGHKRWDGKAWSGVQIITPTEKLFSIWGSGPSDIFAGGLNATYLFDGAKWTNTSISGGYVWCLGGLSSKDVFAGAASIGARVLNYDGKTWTKIMQPSGVARFTSLRAVPAEKEIWIGGWKGIIWRLKRL